MHNDSRSKPFKPRRFTVGGFTVTAFPHEYGGLTYEIDLGGGKTTTTRPRFIDLDGLRIGIQIAITSLLDPFRVRPT